MIQYISNLSLMRECWQWEASRRPTFREMKYDMENMFQVTVDKMGMMIMMMNLTVEIVEMVG